MLLNGLDIIALPRRLGQDRGLTRRGYDFRRGNLTQGLVLRFANRVQRILKFVFLNRHTFLAGLFELIENLLGLVDLFRFAFQSYPAFPRCDFYTERILQILQEFEVVGVKRLQRPRALKFQGPRFSHSLADQQDRQSRCDYRNP